MAAEARSGAPVGGRWVAAAVVVAGVVALAVGGTSLAWFAMLSAVVLVGTAYSAYHWPRATLVGVGISTLLDPGVAVRLLPGFLADGPIGVSEPLLAVAGLVALTRAGRAGVETALREPTVGLAALFVGASILSALVNGTPPEVAAFGIVMTIDAMAIFFVWIALRPSVEVTGRSIAAIVAAGAVVALFGIGQVLLAPSLLGFERFSPRPEEVGSITSFLGNPNLLAPVLGFLLPFPLFAMLRLGEPRRRALAAAIALVLLVALLLTFSRGSWAAALAGIGIGTLLLDRRVLLMSAGLAALAAVVVLVMPHHLVSSEDLGPAVPAPSQAVVGASPEASPEPETPPAPTPPPDPYRGRTSEEVRLIFLRDGLRIVGDNPAFGVGPGRYGGAVAKILGSPVYEEYGTSLGRLRTVHNFWLHLVGEVGIVGVVPFLGLVIALIIRLVRAARGTEGMRFVLLAGAATAAVVVSINNLTEMVFEGNIPAVIVWLILGVGAALAPDPRLGILRGGRTSAE
jgi:O-antigen ligase